MTDELNGTLELVYANMPQNDKQQIEQVVREYESDPAKGLAHGVQKDAIQNAFGARATTDEVKACQKNWCCYFELVLGEIKPWYSGMKERLVLQAIYCLSMRLRKGLEKACWDEKMLTNVLLDSLPDLNLVEI